MLKKNKKNTSTESPGWKSRGTFLSRVCPTPGVQYSREVIWANSGQPLTYDLWSSPKREPGRSYSHLRKLNQERWDAQAVSRGAGGHGNALEGPTWRSRRRRGRGRGQKEAGRDLGRRRCEARSEALERTARKAATEVDTTTHRTPRAPQSQLQPWLPFSRGALYSMEPGIPSVWWPEWPPCRMLGASGLKETWCSVHSGFADYGQDIEGRCEQGAEWTWWSAASRPHLRWSKRKLTLKAFTQLHCASGRQGKRWSGYFPGSGS